MIVMRETATGYRGSEFPLREALVAIFLAIAFPLTALSGLWGAPTREKIAPLAALAAALMGGATVSLVSAWRRRRWIEVAFSGGTVRWGSGRLTLHESAVARFDVQRLEENGPFCLTALQDGGEPIGLQPEWVARRARDLEPLARRLNELTRT